MRISTISILVFILIVSSCQMVTEPSVSLSVSDRNPKPGDVVTIKLDYVPKIGKATGIIKIDDVPVEVSENFPVTYTWRIEPDDVGSHRVSGAVRTMFGTEHESETIEVTVGDTTPPVIKYVSFSPRYSEWDGRYVLKTGVPIKMFVSVDDPESREFTLSWVIDNGESGSWSGAENVQTVDLGVFEEGNYRMNLKVENEYRLVSSTDIELVFIDDTSPPEIEIDSDEKFDVDDDVFVNINIRDDNEVAYYEVFVDGTKRYDERVNSESIVKSLNLGKLDLGRHVVEVRAYDVSGKMGYAFSNVSVGNLPIGLNVSLSDPGPDGIYDQGETVSIEVSFAKATPVSFEILIDGSTIGTGQKTEWIAIAGYHDLSVVATSTEGEEEIYRALLKVSDENPPSLKYVFLNGTEVDPSSPVELNTDQVVIKLVFEDESWMANDNITVFISNSPTMDDVRDFLNVPIYENDGKTAVYIFPYELPEGNYYIFVSDVKDVYGNSADDPIHVLSLKIRGG